MSATAGYNGKIYIIDDTSAFSAAFTNEATTESGVTKKYQIDDTDKRIWDINEGVTVGGYWAFQEFALSTTSGANSGLASATQYYFKLAIDGDYAYQEFGLSTTDDADSGLSAATQYYFKIAIDGGAATEYDITTGSGTVTWANLIALIDAEITDDGATCYFTGGDVRIRSDATTGASAIVCSAGTTGTSIFGQGNVPAVGSLETSGITEYDITTGAGTVTWANVVTLIDAEITAAGATCEFIDGDVRIHSDDTTSSSDISLAAGSSGTSLFGQGSVPAVTSLETVDYTDICVNTVGYANSGIDYSVGTVQMNHTGFTSLVVTGKYHTLKTYAQFTGYNITINCNAVDTTALQATFKTNVPTTKNISASMEGVYTDDEFFTLQANGTLFFKVYVDYSNTVGYQFFGTLSYSANVTPHEVVRESLTVDVTGNITYFTS